ncbi:MAG: tRNA uracil 4-sulfurtransferase ThiI [Clostridia bacterium]|nr:tRNA uracil 4-sulfurtransferase ThiI [Clostridia bacterium]
MDKIILLKYGEIILKGLNRPRFEKILVDNISQYIDKTKVKVWRAQATIYVEPLTDDVDMQKLAEKLSKVFGIVAVALAHVVPKDMDAICKKAAEIASMTKGKTFKVEAKRADKKFPFKSPEICMQAGGYTLSKNSGLKVDVHNPDFVINVEIRDFAAYLYAEKIQGVGGMPIGTNGKATLLLSGGIDSPVAGYMIAKRGVELNAVHFYSYPYTSERAKEKVLDLAQILANYCGEIKVHVVPFTDIQLAINDKCPEEQLTVIMRRIMMQIADKIATDTGSYALITGESIGQVASQTIQALAVTNAVVGMPVFRPLIGMDKDEIIQISRKIGTFETSILPYEDCCTVFTPKHPTTKPNIERIMQSESKLELEDMIKTAIENTEVITLSRK